MAGSYDHVVDERGNLLTDSQAFTDMIENLGDAYEAIEEMYGMIWHLVAGYAPADAKAIVERASQNYRDGLEVARRVNGENP